MELTKEYFDQQLGNLARREDLEQLASKEDLHALKDDILGLKDDVTTLQGDMRSVKFTLQEMNQTLIALDKRDKEDSDAFAEMLVSHGKRLTTVEQDINQLKLGHASR